MGRTFKKQTQENKTRKVKNEFRKKSSTKRQKHYDYNGEEEELYE